MSFYLKFREKLYNWLTYDPPAVGMMPYDFNRLKHEIRPGDVLLIEGRSRISSIIRTITQSPWTHAALYIGRLIDFEDEEIKDLIRKHLGEAKDNTRLIIEDLIDKGTTVAPITTYRDHHIRICRPIGITPTDLHLVISYAVKALGQPYNVRHMVDLARFLLPWSVLPRRWGSSLFLTSTGQPASGICSSLIAEAFASVQFPILPFVMPHKEEGLEVFLRNPHLYTPKDFDYSPYFDIIKYPLFNPDEPLPYYRRLPWTRSGMIHQDHGVLTGPDIPRKRSKIFGKQEEKKDEPLDNNEPPTNQD